MSYCLIRFEDHIYANEELYVDAVAGGERQLIKMLAKKEVESKVLLDQALYPLSSAQEKRCLEFSPSVQDFDEFFKYLNVVSKDVIKEIDSGNCPSLPGATVIKIGRGMLSDLYKYRQVMFFKARDYRKPSTYKYRIFERMAAVKVCGCVYVTLNAVDVRIEKPILAVLKD